MVYDEELTARMRRALAGQDAISEKRMMGGVCFFQNGNMLSGADRSKEGVRRLMFRVGKENQAEALARPGAAVMEMGGRKMSGFVFVDPEACDDGALGEWIDLARSFVGTLPAKS